MFFRCYLINNKSIINKCQFSFKPKPKSSIPCFNYPKRSSTKTFRNLVGIYAMNENFENWLGWIWLFFSSVFCTECCFILYSGVTLTLSCILLLERVLALNVHKWYLPHKDVCCQDRLKKQTKSQSKTSLKKQLLVGSINYSEILEMLLNVNAIWSKVNIC